MVEQNTETELVAAPSASGQIGQRSLEISNAIARLHKQFIGRGPTNSRTTIDGDLIVVLLEGGYTRAEQTLGDDGKSEVVLASRAALQETMRQALIAAVQAIVDRKVASFMSANDLGRNLQVEIFVLAPERPGSSPSVIGP